MKNYIKIVENAVTSLSYRLCENDSHNGICSLTNLDELQHLLELIQKDPKLLDELNNSIEFGLTYEENVSRLRGNENKTIQDTDCDGSIIQILNPSPNFVDNSTKNIVNRLHSRCNGHIYYSEIYDEVIDECIKNYEVIKFFDTKQVLQYFPQVLVMDMLYKNTYNNEKCFYLLLKDEIIMHYQYNNGKYVYAFTGTNSLHGDMCGKKNRLMDLFKNDFYKMVLPSETYLLWLSSNAEKNPYSLTYSAYDFGKFEEFIKSYLEDKGIKKSPKVSKFKQNNRDSLIEDKLLDFYYFEKVFKPSYIKGFIIDFFNCVERLVTDRYFELVQPLYSLHVQLDENLEKAKASMKELKKMDFQNDFNVLNILDYVYDTLNILKEKLRGSSDKLNQLSDMDDLKNIQFITNISFCDLPNFWGQIDRVLNAIEQIKAFITSDDSLDCDKEDLLIKLVYYYHDWKIDLTPKIYSDGGLKIPLNSHVQAYGKKRILNDTETISGVDVLQLALQGLEQSKKSPSFSGKADPKSKNARKRFCEVVLNAQEYCCNLIENFIINKLTDEYLVDMLLNENEIDSIYNELLYRYKTITNNGDSFICRDFINCDKRFIRNFEVLNSDVVPYIICIIDEIKTSLEKEHSLMVEFDPNYLYSADFYNIIEKIKNNICEFSKGSKCLLNDLISQCRKDGNTLLADVLQDEAKRLENVYIGLFLHGLFEKD